VNTARDKRVVPTAYRLKGIKWLNKLTTLITKLEGMYARNKITG
jgi:hypothetical protein